MRCTSDGCINNPDTTVVGRLAAGLVDGPPWYCAECRERMTGILAGRAEGQRFTHPHSAEICVTQTRIGPLGRVLESVTITLPKMPQELAAAVADIGCSVPGSTVERDAVDEVKKLARAWITAALEGK